MDFLATLLGSRRRDRVASSKTYRHYVAGCIVAALLVARSASAQPIGPPPGVDLGTRRPSEQQPPLPALEPAVPPSPLRLPPARPSPDEEEPLPSGLRVFVREFRLTGNTVFSSQELAEVTAPYENRYITSAELQAVRRALTLHYVNGGYINSGATIPDQKITDNVIEIRITEGQLTDIEVEGTTKLHPAYISDRLALGAGPPLNVNDLQEQLLILLQSPLVERINADLRPGERPGEARLRAHVKEGSPYRLTSTVDNDISPSIGDVRGLVRGDLSNLTGGGDTLTTQMEFAEGLSGAIYLSYARPLNARDTKLTLFGERKRSEIVEAPFDRLDIESKSWTVGFRLSHPFYRTPWKQFTVSAGLSRRHTQTYLNGNPFSFVQTRVPPDGESNVSVIRFSQEWLSRAPNQALAARSMFSIGIDAFGATDGEPCVILSKEFSCVADGEFVSWLGQLQWVRRIGDVGAQLIVRANVQLAKDPLLPLEQFQVGGLRSVRGYRKNLLVRDSGYDASLEFRVPLLRNQAGRNVLDLATFADIGGAWDRKEPTPSPENIQGAGVGLLWDPHPQVHAEFYWAHAFENVRTASNSPQDDGLYFLLSANIFD